MTRDWTADEIDLLRAQYIKGGIHAALAALPHRTESALRAAIRKAGIRLDNPHQFHYRVHQSAHLDAAIRKAFQRRSDGDCQALRNVAKAFGVPVKYVRDRGSKLGVSQSRETVLWKTAEDDIIQDYLEGGIGKIQTMLRRNGYHRTLWAVKRRKELLGLRRVGTDYWSAADVAIIFGVAEQTVRRWVGWGLPAKKIKLFGAPNTPPHKWGIRPADLKVWLRDNPHKWHFRNVQHHGIVLELLAGPPAIDFLR